MNEMWDEAGYLETLKDILYNGKDRMDRTGTGTRGKFGLQVRYDLTDDRWPVFTTKKVHLPSVIHELLWFIKGDTNIKYLKDNNVRIWDEWADEDGNLGPVYGYQWRNYPKIHDTKDWGWDIVGHVDQLMEVQRQLREDKHSRRIILSAWNPGMIDQMALPPCHAFVQFLVDDTDNLTCILYQRSADMFLGVPFNVASYSLLTHMLAKVCGLKAYEFVHVMGDAHIYHNHFEQCKEQLSRGEYPSPKISLPKLDCVLEYAYYDIQCLDYIHHPAIKAKVAV